MLMKMMTCFKNIKFDLIILKYIRGMTHFKFKDYMTPEDKFREFGLHFESIWTV
jgi:hypothetical protein